jgi:hypothetical protein
MGASCLESSMLRLRDSVLVEVVEAVFVLLLYLIYHGLFVFWYFQQVWGYPVWRYCQFVAGFTPSDLIGIARSIHVKKLDSIVDSGVGYGAESESF